MSIEEKLSNLVGLQCVVLKDYSQLENDGSKVSFSIRGVLECKSNFYRLNVSTESFVSFCLSDVCFVVGSTIELK